MANKPTQPVFPLGLVSEEQSTLAGILNTGTIEHGPDAVLTLPEGNASAGLPSSVRYNADSDEFEGFYENGGWLPLGGGVIRWEALPHASTATLTEGRGYLVDNSTGVSTVVFPSPTRIGDSVTVCDLYGKFSLYPLTIDPNGRPMYGSVEPMTLSTDSVSATFTWSGDARGWIVTAGVGLGQGRVYSRTIFTETVASDTAQVTLTTQPSIVDVYVDGKRLLESKYSLNGFNVDFSPSILSGSELQVIQYVPIQLGVGGGGSGGGTVITWIYNSGSAVGGETEIELDVDAEDVSEIYIGGSRQQKGLGFNYDPITKIITLADELEAGDEVVVVINGDPTLYNQIDHTPNEVARSTNVPVSQVILTSDTITKLDGKTVIYDVNAQKMWSLPSGIPTGASIVSVSGSNLTYAPGNVVVPLLPAPGSKDALEAYKNELLAGNTGLVSASAVVVTPQGTLAEMQYYVTPEQFSHLVTAGEYVDENTDFTLAVQGAVDYAASHPGVIVRGTEKVYGVSRILVTVGVKVIDGLKLKCVVANTDTLLYSFVDTGHTDLQIRNCILNGNNNTRKGIIVSGVIRATIEKNYVYGLDGTGEAYGIRIGTTSTTSMNINNKISDNVIEMPTDPWAGTGNYAICGIGMIGQITSLYGGLDTNAGVPLFPSTITLRDTIIEGNFISGGTHGVQGLGLFRTLITKNHIMGNTHRNINLSPNCQRVNIVGNLLIEGGSSGVNVAWGCRWINISGNHIQTSTASVSPSDDAAIQLYKGVDQCTVSGNTILGDWKYSVYMGAGVTNVSVNANGLFAGSLASIAVESDWVLTADYPLAIYSSSRNPNTTPIAGDTGNINIGGNAYGAGSCAIYLAATNSKAMYNVNIHDEVINSVTSRPHVVYAYDAGTLMTDGSLTNIAARGATASKYYLSRGRGAFNVIRDVTALDDPKGEVTVSGGTPSAVFGPNLYIASGTITDFTGAQSGDIINLRMGDGVVLTHNSTVMRLKGGVNATASGGLAIMTLQRRAGVWFEMSRNF
ncbi:hypothetical protein [Salmonella phage SKML-39]|uniref:Right handed beta helix domain-containing protein n=1 Tax=Salmonella phage SKML-39 TaxID=1204528 RepID=K4I6X7_9CAUD|nr:hypothetical protein G178_gp207 [Salmonella phage SKML-39]AFU64550.1 hypothetical protein [Salmonella phage SKML-39]